MIRISASTLTNRQMLLYRLHSQNTARQTGTHHQMVCRYPSTNSWGISVKWKSNRAHRANRYEPMMPMMSASMIRSTRDSHLRSTFPMYRPIRRRPLSQGGVILPPLPLFRCHPNIAQNNEKIKSKNVVSIRRIRGNVFALSAGILWPIPGGSACQKSLAEFAARRPRIRFDPFFTAACTS